MSYFSLPRLYFNGFFTTNVSTANNDRVIDLFDVENIKIYDQWKTKSDEEIRRFLMQTKLAPDLGGGEPEVWLNGYFNYFGDHSTTFNRTLNGQTDYTLITGGHLNADPTSAENKMVGDPLYLARVELLGDGFMDRPDAPKMVDLNPVGTYGTQIIGGALRISATIDGQQVVLMEGKNPTPGYIRYLGGPRNLNPGIKDGPRSGPATGLAMWQSGIAKSDIIFNTSVYSPALNWFRAQVEKNKGIIFAYCTYYCIDGIAEGELAELFKQANYQKAIMNAAYGKLAGIIGVWDNSDKYVSMPLARLLFAKNIVPTSPAPEETDPGKVRAHQVKGAEDIGDSDDSGESGYPLQTTFATVDTQNKILTLDLLLTIPEKDSTLEKVNLGDLTVKAKYNGTEYPIGTLTYYENGSQDGYNKANYERNSGMIQMRYDPNYETALQNGQILIYGTFNGQARVLLEEINYAFTESDTRNTYITIGETANIPVQVFYKGQPYRFPIQITLEQYADIITTPGDDHTLPGRAVVSVKNDPQYQFISYPSTVTTFPDGSATITVQGIKPGCALLRFRVAGDTSSPDFEATNPFYVSVRVFAKDDYSHLPDSAINWDLVYNEVIRYYYLLYPGMFERLPFNREEVARANATLIKRIISKRGIESSAFMPVTREMSDGKRQLLQRWCGLNE